MIPEGRRVFVGRCRGSTRDQLEWQFKEDGFTVLKQEPGDDCEPYIHVVPYFTEESALRVDELKR